jgi:hypothetical protein
MGNGKRILDHDLACEIGVKEALVFQQIHYWMGKKPHERDGRYWIYNTMSAWQQQLAFYSQRTIERAIKTLTNLGIVISGNHNKNRNNRTRWYSVSYDHSILIQCGIKAPRQIVGSTTTDCRQGPRQNVGIDSDKMAGSLHKKTKKIATLDYYTGGSDGIKKFYPSFTDNKVLDAFKRLHNLQKFDIRREIYVRLNDLDVLPGNMRGYMTKCVQLCMDGEFEGYTMPSLEYCIEKCGE